MYHLEIFPCEIQNIRIRKELEKIKDDSNFEVTSVTANCKQYTGFMDPIGKNVDYTLTVDLQLYLYIDNYINCELLYWKNYPFRQPDCHINGIEYRKLLFRYNSERYKDKDKYGIILKKFINYGFTNCPCCDSLFYKNQNNFAININDYVNEIKRFALCYYNRDRLKIAQTIMNKKIGVEFESVYEYLVGKV